jgi:hypothetical protein
VLVDKPIELNGFRYQIIKPLGTPGAVAEAYLADALDFGIRVVVKMPSRASPLGQQAATEQLKGEANVLITLNQAEVPAWPIRGDARARAAQATATVNQRVIVAGLDDGKTVDGQYCAIQELAPAAVEPVAVTDLRSELRALAVAQRAAFAVSIAHRCGIALQDFVPQSKIDRLRAEWDGDYLKNFKVIDWNISGGPSEIPNDLIFLGNLIFALLTGVFPPLYKKDEQTYDLPPFVPAVVAGPAWERLSGGSRLFLNRLTNRLPTQRPSSAASIADEIRWLENLLRMQDASPARWVELELSNRDYPGRVIAIVATARARIPADRFPSLLDDAERSAQQILEAGNERFLREVKNDLKDWVFSDTLARLNDWLDGRRLDPSSEIARKAHYLRQQALFAKGVMAKGDDVRRSDDYRGIDLAVDRLASRNWAEAYYELSRISPLWFGAPQPGEEQAMKEARQAARALLATAKWRLEYEDLCHAIDLEKTAPDDAGLPGDTMFVEKENARLARLQQLRERLESWQQDAPFEYDLQTQVFALGDQLERRRKFLEDLPTIRKKIEVGDTTTVVELCRQFLHYQPNHSFAKALMREAEENLRLIEELQVCQRSLESGNYALAEAKSQALYNSRPSDISDATWNRVCNQTGLTDIIKKSSERKVQWQEVEESLKKNRNDVDSLENMACGLPDVSALEIPTEEEKIAQNTNSILNQARTWRDNHEKGQLILSHDQLTKIGEIEQQCGAILKKLFDRWLGNLGSALDCFGRTTAASAAVLIKQLQDLNPPPEHMPRIKQLEIRLNHLKTLWEQTEQNLQDDDKAIRCFAEVAADPAVAGPTRVQFLALVRVWDRFKSDPDRLYLLPEWAGTGEAWSAWQTFRDRLHNRMLTGIGTKASQQFSEGDMEKATRLYRELVQGGVTLTPEQQEECDDIPNLQSIAQRVEALEENEDVQSKDLAAVWKEKDPQEKKSLQDFGNNPRAQQLEERIQSIWERHLWNTLPDPPEASDLEWLAVQFEEGYKITWLNVWHIYAELCRSAADLVRRKVGWGDLDQWLAQQTKNQEVFKTLRSASSPARLVALAGGWYAEWRSAFNSHWRSVRNQVDEQFAQENVDGALKLTQILEHLAESGIPIDRAATEDLSSLHNRAQALKDRNEAFDKTLGQLADTQAFVSKTQVDDLRLVLDDVHQYELPSQSVAEALLTRIEAVYDKQQALQLPLSEENYARCIAALQSARQVIHTRISGSVSQAWLKRLEDWDGRLKMLDDKIDVALPKARAMLDQGAEEVISQLVSQISAGTPDHSTATRAAKLLWQTAWPVQAGDDLDGSAEKKLDILAEKVVKAAEEVRDKSIRECDGAQAHKTAANRFALLTGTFGILTTRPDVTLPGVPETWSPPLLTKLKVKGPSWSDLRESWDKINKHLPLNVAALDERIAVIDGILSSVSINSTDTGALAQAHKTLIQVKSVVKAKEKIDQYVVADNLPEAQRIALTLPRELNSAADWLLPERPEWLSRPSESAEKAIRSRIEPMVEAALKKAETQAIEDLKSQVLPLAGQGIKGEVIQQAIEEAAKTVASSHERKRGDRARAIGVWRVVRSIADPDLGLADLRPTANREIRRMEGAGLRNRFVAAVIFLALFSILLLAAFSKRTIDQININATATAQIAEATSMAKTQSAQATATAQTATAIVQATQTEQAKGIAGCDKIDIEVLSKPDLSYVSAGTLDVTLTWKVKNNAVRTSNLCEWGPQGAETDKLEVVGVVGPDAKKFIPVTLKYVEENVYELTLTTQLSPGEHNLTWQLLVPSTRKPEGLELGARVNIATPTPTPTPTPTVTPTPTSTATPTYTPTPTPTATPCPTRLIEHCRPVCTPSPRGEDCRQVCDYESVIDCRP